MTLRSHWMAQETNDLGAEGVDIKGLERILMKFHNKGRYVSEPSP